MIASIGSARGSVLHGLPPEVFQAIRTWHQSGWTPMRHLGTPADGVCGQREVYATLEKIANEGRDERTTACHLGWVCHPVANCR